MGPWKTEKLGKLCSISIGGTPARANPVYWDASKTGSNLWASIKDLRNRFVKETEEQITDAGVRHSNVKLVKAGTVLMSFKLTIGRVALAGRDLYTNEAIAAFVTEQADSTFLYYGLQNWNLLAGVDQAIKGATLNKSKLKEIDVHLPVLKEEQRRIADVLTTVDQAIEQTEALIAKRYRIKRGLMQDLLTRGIDEGGRLRDPATHKFKASPLGKIPDEWEVCTLGELVDSNRPIVYGILMPGTGFHKGVPVVKVKDIYDGEIDASGLLLTHPKIDQAYRRSRLQSGDLLFTIRGTVGRMAFVPDVLNNANITQDTARIGITKANPKFVRHFLDMPVARAFIEMHTIGQAVRGINLAEVRRIPMLRPPPKEQDILSKMLDAQDALATAERQRLEKLSKLKFGLMQDLLTGKVSVEPLLELQAATNL